MGLAGRELPLRVAMRARVVGVLLEGLARPFGHGVRVAVVPLRVEDVVYRELPAHHELLEIGGAVLPVADLGGAHGERDLDGRDLAEMQVGAQV
ncbi:hypothetical protein QU38_00635 [Staphylococcus aureus]|uniref:Uncharacterized protein n=1 Tax=Staphylococcus aureus TaxID=1280 RepID=A0AA40JRL6_STAAU|nr:hypothetical protein QU38_00635 [Staphylococcus aureus]